MSVIDKEFLILASMLEDYHRSITDLNKALNKESKPEIIYDKRDSASDLAKKIIEIFKSKKFFPQNKLKIRKLQNDFDKLSSTLTELSRKVISLKENEIEEIRSFSSKVQHKSMVRKSTITPENEQEILDDESKLQIDLVRMNEVIEDRYKEITEIEGDVVAIKGMMDDVHQMVFEQGEKLNMVEVEIEKTNQNVKKAVQELQTVEGF